MKGDLVCIDGRPVRWGDPAFDAERLPGGDFIYQKIHTIAHKPLQWEMHMEILETSWQTLYRGQTGITREILHREIAALLDANRYPQGGNLVTLCLFPPSDGEGDPLRLLFCEKQLLYKGYTLWHDALRAILTPYEYPFAQHKTAVSLAAHNYAEGYARRRGADAAIAENYRGIVTGVGENPLFAVRGGEAHTTPIEDGVAESVERRLGLAACESAGLVMLQQPVESAQLREFDELFTVTPQGLVSIGRYAGRLFPNSAAKHIAACMERAAGTLKV